MNIDFTDKDELTSSPKAQGTWSVVQASECPRQKGNKEPTPIHLPKSLGVAFPANPPISAPENGWPLSPWIKAKNIIKGNKTYILKGII